MLKLEVPQRRSPYWLLLLLPVAALILPLAPEGRLRCDKPWLRDSSPEGGWTLDVCRVPIVFAMPGGSSDAPGWIVLRDASGAIRGVSWLGMVQLYGAAGGPVEWGPEQVRVPLVAELPLVPATGPVDRWLVDRLWRLRALLGLVPTNDDFH